MDSKTAPTQGGGGVKKKRRKRGGAGSQSIVNNVKVTNGGGGSAQSGRGGGKGGNKKGRRGGGGRGGGGGESSRFGRNASSPLQLPHIKVTLRNIGDVNKHGSIEAVVDSVRLFLEGAFPSIAEAADGSESNPYMMAWHMEKDEFENAKNMFAEAANSGGDLGAASPSGRAFSSGWVYEDKPSTLLSDRLSLLPSPEAVVMDLINNKTERKITDSSGVNFVVDSAMSQMMQECGKKYLSFVGGHIVFDEESAVDVVLAKKVQSERKRLAEEKKKENSVEVGDESSDQPSNTDENVTADDKTVETISVEDVTKGVENISTSDRPLSKLQVLNHMPMIRVRILSATPVKVSKRRGEIAGKVQLAMYPPDPCLLFKESCRDAGKMAAEKHLENSENVASELTGGENVVNKDGLGKETVSPDGTDIAVVDIQTDAKDANSKPPPPAENTVPQIPYFPLLSPAERSRAVARSRALLHRSIEAMKLHAAAQSQISRNREAHSWEVLESSSQKTWKGRPNAMVGSMMAGTPLRDLVVEHESTKSRSGVATANKGRGKGFYGDSRADRYDSTIENSEDYKAFMESLKDGTVPPQEPADRNAAAKKKGDSKPAESDPAPPAVDEEGRPLSAIVMHLREKQAESSKAKVEAAAAVAKARVAAASAKEKIRKDKLKMKKEATKKRKKEAARSKKSGRVSSSSSRPVSGGGSNNKGASMPPMLLKKGSGSAIPASGFGVP
mmetsp:Transcript_28532/g.53924  ORF Transcript_28532/g.53924 Transcript_28532/m.53924 type:complete len:728 (+) Transcript_28532:395-2578(+)|eukprot:CAMPEP_0201683950 /NCGR_PEP_ID=MMETSP0494-20130426/52389_1 /ASSEMBLY_ACC=CAM_ASM_000839 /TAXON_ID=420259 /ORGANISM="Thalassiosira gravida, Strain GMp14c1" /LENGTH=727 /DNA_ID=CAMNT_0048167737 /DNA_START=331 /DNA_END=2514 /DNA_ORIENTATION=+